MSKKSPQLRFEGFTDDWEERKIKDIFKITRGQVLAATETSEEKSDISPFPVYSSQTKNNGLMGYYKDYLFDTAITWTTDGANAGTVSYRSGRFYSTNVNGVLISDKGYTNKAISEILNLEAWKWVSHVGNPKLMNNVMGDISIMIPSSFEEQDRLSDFLNQLDDTIALHQRKLDLLKEQKKGYLQKMFPKNGEKVPELRFAGFADDWEERKLSDVANHRGGTAIEKYFDKDGVYKVISIGSYGLNSQYVDQNIRAISNEITDGRVVNSGELTMVLNDKTANGTIIGRSLLVEKDNEYVINQRTEIISPKENFDSNFAYTILNGPFREKVKRIVQGGTQIYVNYPAVSNLNLELPKIEEQQKIGSFFKQLDDTIALHQRKLDLLKEQKKGFLQKMFV